MFDPTVFDNVKVVLEGELYELDSSKKISIINRKDIVDLASMSRKFMMSFKEYNCVSSHPFAEIHLHTDLQNFQMELLQKDPQAAGCTVTVFFYIELMNGVTDCDDIEAYLNVLCSHQATISQQIYYDYCHRENLYNKVSLHFVNKIGEEDVDELLSFIYYTYEALQQFTLRYCD